MSKNIRINKYFYVFTLCCLLIGARISAASEAFKNSLIRMDFAKISGGVQVKLYTNKPYGDSVSVVRKSDNEYAILMPETSNSMTASPILNPVSGVVRGVSVKTQQYENGVKGYTKVLISTTSPIEIVPQVKAINVSDYQLSENDYSELLAQTSKKPKTATTQKPKAKLKTTQKSVDMKPHSKPDLNQKSRVGLLSHQQKTANALNAASTQKAKPQQAIQQAIEKPKQVRQSVSQPVSQPVESPKSLQETAPIATTEATNVPSPSPTAAPTQNALPAPTPVVQTPIQPAPKLTFTQKLINVSENPRLLYKYKDVVMNNLYLIGGAALIVFLLLLLGARRMTKGIKNQKEAFTKNLNETPMQTSNFMDQINENMTWKEKYQTYVAASNQQQEAPSEAPAQNTAPEEPTPSPFEGGEELNELFEAEPENTISQEPVNTQSSINEDILAQYEQLERDLIAETDVPQHEISGREDVFGKDRLDELFGMDENNIFGEENDFDTEDYSFNEMPQEPIKPRASFYEPLANAPISEPFVEPFVEPMTESFTGSFTEPAAEPFTNIDDVKEVENVKSEFVIDAKRGFYLVDYKDSSALIGHIEDEVFILKQFKEKIEGTLQARLDEHKGTSANYMTKVGSKFKALVEVKPDNMNLLIEL